MAEVQQLAKCCLAFIICFYCPNLVRALVMFGWNNCFLYLISCNLVWSVSLCLQVSCLLLSYCKWFFVVLILTFWIFKWGFHFDSISLHWHKDKHLLPLNLFGVFTLQVKMLRDILIIYYIISSFGLSDVRWATFLALPFFPLLEI